MDIFHFVQRIWIMTKEEEILSHFHSFISAISKEHFLSEILIEITKKFTLIDIQYSWLLLFSNIFHFYFHLVLRILDREERGGNFLSQFLPIFTNKVYFELFLSRSDVRIRLWGSHFFYKQLHFLSNFRQFFQFLLVFHTFEPKIFKQLSNLEPRFQKYLATS